MHQARRMGTDNLVPHRIRIAVPFVHQRLGNPTALIRCGTIQRNSDFTGSRHIPVIVMNAQEHLSSGSLTQ